MIRAEDMPIHPIQAAIVMTCIKKSMTVTPTPSPCGNATGASTSGCDLANAMVGSLMQWQAVCVPAALQVTWPLPCSFAELVRAPLGCWLPCPKQAAN